MNEGKNPCAGGSLHRDFFDVTSINTVSYTHLDVYKRQDHKGPVLSARSESITVGLDASDQEILEGIAAFDDKDGDVSDSIPVSYTHLLSKFYYTFQYSQAAENVRSLYLF